MGSHMAVGTSTMCGKLNSDGRTLCRRPVRSPGAPGGGAHLGAAAPRFSTSELVPTAVDPMSTIDLEQVMAGNTLLIEGPDLPLEKGWHPDPEVAGRLQYFDGERFVDGMPTVSVHPVLELGADPATAAAVADLAAQIEARGGQAIVVGGSVRDMLVARMENEPTSAKDVDIEVFGLEPGELRALLESNFRVDATGASFEVWKAYVPGTQEPLDISLPRRERATGLGHRDFMVEADPHMTFSEAARRRDFTIGAMGYNPLTGELLDPYGGAQDLSDRVLRHVSDAFDEDPLRALRAARFAARFGLSVDPETAERCRRLRPQGDHLPAERNWGELAMTLKQAKTPGRALHVLDEIAWIDMFAEVADLRGVEQEKSWHPEGDVFIHTAHVLDYWGTHLRTGNHEDDMVVAVAALCHDLGKAKVTQVLDGRIRALDHERAGVGPTRSFLEGLGQLRLADQVAPLVENHLAPVVMGKDRVSDKALRRLSTKVERLDLLAAVARADQGGRPPLDVSKPMADIDWFSERVRSLGVETGPPKRLATGDHLISLGLKPGREFKVLLDKAYEAQLAGDIGDEAAAKEFLSGLIQG